MSLFLLSVLYKNIKTKLFMVKNTYTIMCKINYTTFQIGQSNWHFIIFGNVSCVLLLSEICNLSPFIIIIMIYLIIDII